MPTRLTAALSACTGGDPSADAIARAAGVNRSTVYRWLADGAVRETKHVRALLAVWDRHSGPDTGGRRAKLASALCGSGALLAADTTPQGVERQPTN